METECVRNIASGWERPAWIAGLWGPRALHLLPPLLPPLDNGATTSPQRQAGTNIYCIPTRGRQIAYLINNQAQIQ